MRVRPRWTQVFECGDAHPALAAPGRAAGLVGQGVGIHIGRAAPGAKPRCFYFIFPNKAIQCLRVRVHKNVCLWGAFSDFSAKERVKMGSVNQAIRFMWLEAQDSPNLSNAFKRLEDTSTQ